MIKRELSENKEPVMHKSGENISKVQRPWGTHNAGMFKKKQEGHVVRIYEQQKGW